MRVRRSYDVSSPEAGAVSSRDKNLVATRHHWIVPLSFFFILCGVVLAVSWLSVRTTKSAKNETGGTSESFKSATTTSENESETVASTTTLKSSTTTSEDRTSKAPTTIRSSRTPSAIETTEAPTTLQSSTTPSAIETTEAPTTIRSSRTPSALETTEAPTTLQSSTTPSAIETTEAPTTIRSSTTPSAIETTEAPTTLQSSTTPSAIETTEAPTTIRSSTTPSALETTEAPTTLQSSTTPSAIETTKAPTTIRSSTTPSAIETTEAPTTLQSSTTPSAIETTKAPTTIRSSTTPSAIETTEAPTTLQSSTTPSAIETTKAPTTIRSSTTPSAIETTEAPTTLQSSTTPSAFETTEAPTTIRSSTTPSAIETTEAPTTIWSSTTPSAFETTEAPTTLQSSTTTSEGATSETPTTMRASTTTTSTSETPAEKMCYDTRKAINQTARPCEDFYEYACGGFEASNATSEKDPAEEGIKRIFDQANKENTTYSNFLKYFESCMSYEQNTTREDRMNLALKHIGEVGNFSTARPAPENFDVISMLSKLLLRDSSPLFDIILDFDPEEDLGKQHKLVLKMVPPVFKSTLCVDIPETCYAKQMEAMTDDDDEDDYDDEEYGDDENNENSMGPLNSEKHSDSVMDAVKQFPEFMRRYDRDTIKSGVKYILKEILKLRGVEPSKVTALPENEPHELDFKKLLERSIDSTELKNQRIYSNPDFAFEIRKILQSRDNAQRLNNGLLGLYVYKIYNEMVLPGRTEAYCRRAATSLMQQDAVNLYLSSFPTEERERRNNLSKSMFQKLRDTFKSDVQDAAWLNVTRVAVENKIDKMSIELPYLPDDDENAPEKVPVTLTGNFLHDTVMLQGQSRRAMYRMLGETANKHNIWTYFAVPYQTSVSVIYNLNKVVVPYETVDWSGILRTSEPSLEYLRIATLGTAIAHGIGRHFDQTGMMYYNHSITNSSNEIFYCGKPCEADSVYRAYTYVHKLRGKNENRIKLPSTGTDVTYTLDDRSLNDRIAEDIGVQLAYRTMQRSSSSSALLPCLGSENQLKEKQFFLAYAQTHCTKEPLKITSPVLLKDGHILPGRIRIAQLAANDYQFMIGTWNCSITSRQDDGSKLKIFPSVLVKPSTAVQNSK